MRTRHFAYVLILMIATLTLAVSRMGASPPEAGGWRCQNPWTSTQRHGCTFR